MDEKIKTLSTFLGDMTTDHMVFVMALASLALVGFALYVVIRVATIISEDKRQ